MIHQIDHVNIVARDLDSMVKFYEATLGMRVTKRVTIRGEWIERVVGLRGAVGEVVYLELDAGPRLELIRYRAPEAPTPRGLGQSNTPGLRHLAFKVSELDALVARLTAAGVRFFSGIESVPDSQVTYAGGVRKRLVYFHDPEGNLLELCEYRAAAPSAEAR